MFERFREDEEESTANPTDGIFDALDVRDVGTQTGLLERYQEDEEKSTAVPMDEIFDALEDLGAHGKVVPIDDVFQQLHLGVEDFEFVLREWQALGVLTFMDTVKLNVRKEWRDAG